MHNEVSSCRWKASNSEALRLHIFPSPTLCRWGAFAWAERGERLNGSIRRPIDNNERSLLRIQTWKSLSAGKPYSQWRLPRIHVHSLAGAAVFFLFSTFICTGKVFRFHPLKGDCKLREQIVEIASPASKQLWECCLLFFFAADFALWSACISRWWSVSDHIEPALLELKISACKNVFDATPCWHFEFPMLLYEKLAFQSFDKAVRCRSFRDGFLAWYKRSTIEKTVSDDLGGFLVLHCTAVLGRLHWLYSAVFVVSAVVFWWLAWSFATRFDSKWAWNFRIGPAVSRLRRWTRTSAMVVVKETYCSTTVTREAPVLMMY